MVKDPATEMHGWRAGPGIRRIRLVAGNDDEHGQPKLGQRIRELGFVLDHDVEHIPGMRVVQLTPPGSSCSIVIGTGMTSVVPGSLEGLQLVVPDMQEARTELLRRGAPISEAQDMGGFAFAYLSDRDGNLWVIQEIPPRAP